METLLPEMLQCTNTYISPYVAKLSMWEV